MPLSDHGAASFFFFNVFSMQSLTVKPLFVQYAQGNSGLQLVFQAFF